MNQVFIGIGSNINHPYFRIYSVLKQINRIKSTRIVKKSSLYETKPLGPQSQPNFINAVIKIETNLNGKIQECWRPQSVYHYIQDNWIDPDFIIDITEVFDQKMDAINAYSSQFFNPESDEPSTPISSIEFMEHIKGRAIAFGRIIGVKYGEGFTVERAPGIKDITSLK